MLSHSSRWTKTDSGLQCQVLSDRKGHCSEKIEKDTIRMFIGLLVVGSIFLVVSLALQQRFEVLKYSLLPIMGSLALSKATGILLIDMPTIKAQRWMLNKLGKKNLITFEYDSD